MQHKRILSVQDISCVGQCSLTVALPLLSALGHECAILPTSLLSSHTAFTHTSFLSLTDEVPSILDAWKQEHISFDALVAGYIGTSECLALLPCIIEDFIEKDGKKIIDPVMGDGGVLYRHLDARYVRQMQDVIAHADLILPNLTEACLLSDIPYRESADQDFLTELHETLTARGACTSVITGVPTRHGRIGISVYDGEHAPFVYDTVHVDRPSHGAGDVFASLVTGRVVSGMPLADAARMAADFTCRAISETPPSHWYGLSFERFMRLSED